MVDWDHIYIKRNYSFVLCLLCQALLAFSIMGGAAHSTEFRTDDSGAIWALVCTSTLNYEVNLMTGERRDVERKNREGQKDTPGNLPENACHNACSRRKIGNYV